MFQNGCDLTSLSFSPHKRTPRHPGHRVLPGEGDEACPSQGGEGKGGGEDERETPTHARTTSFKTMTRVRHCRPLRRRPRDTHLILPHSPHTRTHTTQPARRPRAPPPPPGPRRASSRLVAAPPRSLSFDVIAALRGASSRLPRELVRLAGGGGVGHVVRGCRRAALRLGDPGVDLRRGGRRHLPLLQAEEVVRGAWVWAVRGARPGPTVCGEIRVFALPRGAGPILPRLPDRPLRCLPGRHPHRYRPGRPRLVVPPLRGGGARRGRRVALQLLNLPQTPWPAPHRRRRLCRSGGWPRLRGSRAAGQPGQREGRGAGGAAGWSGAAARVLPAADAAGGGESGAASAAPAPALCPRPPASLPVPASPRPHAAAAEWAEGGVLASARAAQAAARVKMKKKEGVLGGILLFIQSVYPATEERERQKAQC